MKEKQMIAAEYCPNHLYIAQIQCVRNSWIFEREKFPNFDRHANLKYKYGNRTFWWLIQLVKTQKNT